MVRDFDARAVPADVVDRVLDAGRRAPSAGHSQGWAFVVLEGPVQTARYWDVTLPAGERDGFRWSGLLRAPVLIIALAHPPAYLDRYDEPDKVLARSPGLAESSGRWPVPYWTVDTSFAAMTMLLCAVDEGLGALFFGIARDGRELLRTLGVPDGYEPIGTIALGYPAAGERRSGSSVTRPRRPRADVVHRGGW